MVPQLLPESAQSEPNAADENSSSTRIGLKKIPPYWYPYTTMAKARWLGREILEIVSTEFRDRSMEYYRYALESGVTTINGKVAKPETIVRNGDRIENIVHRHEPPVTATPVRIVLHDVEREFIAVDKPGSIPAHPSGRYYRNSLSEILKNDFGYKEVYTINRLDRLTSGLMIIPLSAGCAQTLSKEFAEGTIRKEYIARCRGEFPPEEIVCEQPLLTVDRQMGLNIVHPEGKAAKTIFRRIHYDTETNSSVIHCRPFTGRSHQIRVHLQFLGYPIANDPIYSVERIWGPKLGKDGIDTTPSDERTAPVAPPQFSDNPELLSSPADSGLITSSAATSVSSTSFGENGQQVLDQDVEVTELPKLLPRETGHDIGMGSPVPLSAEAVGIITRLRNMKDEDEDWSRWRDVVFRAKGSLAPHGYIPAPLPAQNQRKRGGPSPIHYKANVAETTLLEALPVVEDEVPPVVQLTAEEALSRMALVEPCTGTALQETRSGAEDLPGEQTLYCPECYLPLHPDPTPEKLYIFLHALRYTTSMGAFETEIPAWAAKGWVWEE